MGCGGLRRAREWGRAFAGRCSRRFNGYQWKHEGERVRWSKGDREQRQHRRKSAGCARPAVPIPLEWSPSADADPLAPRTRHTDEIKQHEDIKRCEPEPPAWSGTCRQNRHIDAEPFSPPHLIDSQAAVLDTNYAEQQTTLACSLYLLTTNCLQVLYYRYKLK